MLKRLPLTVGLLTICAAIGLVAPARASNNWWFGTTNQPACNTTTNAGVNFNGSSVMQLTMGESSCDLMIRDALHAPTLSMHALDVDHNWSVPGGLSFASPYYRYAAIQWMPEASMSKGWQCHIGHRLTVDFYWTSWGSRTDAGSYPRAATEGNLGHHVSHVVCGSGNTW